MKKPGDRSGEFPAARMDKWKVRVAHSASEWRQAKAVLGREHGPGGRAGSAKSLLMFPPQLGLPAAGDGNLRVMAATSSPQTAGGRCNDRRGFNYSEADHTQ